MFLPFLSVRFGFGFYVQQLDFGLLCNAKADDTHRRWSERAAALARRRAGSCGQSAACCKPAGRPDRFAFAGSRRWTSGAARAQRRKSSPTTGRHRRWFGRRCRLSVWFASGRWLARAAAPDEKPPVRLVLVLTESQLHLRRPARSPSFATRFATGRASWSPPAGRWCRLSA